MAVEDRKNGPTEAKERSRPINGRKVKVAPKEAIGIKLPSMGE